MDIENLWGGNKVEAERAIQTLKINFAHMPFVQTFFFGQGKCDFRSFTRTRQYEARSLSLVPILRLCAAPSHKTRLCEGQQ